MVVESESIRRVVDVPEAGRILGVGRNTAYELARKGVIPTIRLGARRVVVPVDRLEALLRGPALGEQR